MSEACQVERWNHTAALLAWMENNAFGGKRRVIEPAERHPFTKQQPQRMNRDQSIKALDKMLGT